MRLLPRTLRSRFRLGASLVLFGLLVEFATLFWVHPISFVLFVFPGATCVGLGILIFLVSVLRSSRSVPE